MYKFKCDVSGAMRKYYNPEFTRGAYHKLVSLKNTYNKSEVDEVTELKTAYSVLLHKYEFLQESMIDLRKQIESSILENKNKVETILNFKFNIIERIKTALLHVTLMTLHYNSDVATKELELMEELGYIPKNSLQHPSIYDQPITLAIEQIKLFVQQNIMILSAGEDYFMQVLRLSVNFFNDKFFLAPQDVFFQHMINHVLKKEKVPELENHMNYAQVKECVAIFTIFCDNVLTIFYNTCLHEPFFVLFEHKWLKMENLSNEHFLVAEDDKFSARSLSSLLNIDDSSMHNFIVPDFSEL